MKIGRSTRQPLRRDYTHRLASSPAREAYLLCQAPRRPARNYTEHRTHTSLCCTVYSEDHTRPQRKSACAEENPNCDSAPWVGSSRHVGARSRRETPLFPMCDSAPRDDCTGDPSKSALGAGGKGTSHPVASSQGLCVLTSDPPWQCSRLGCSSQSLRCRCHHGCT